MNAQQLIQETPVNNFDWKVFWKPKSLSKHTNDDRGDKFVARTGNIQIPAGDSSKGFHTSPSELIKRPLMPQTFDILSQININNIKNTETLKGDVIRSMGIEVL